MKKISKGQSTLEYVIILAAVIGAIIAVAAAINPKITATYSNLTDTMGTKVGQVTF